jgi:TusE/DsrC/DsvC family sulfur relay protein
MPKKRKTQAKKKKAPPLAKAKKTISVRKAKKKAAPSKKRRAATRPSKAPAAQTQARPAPLTMYGIMHPGVDVESDPNFRDAPDGWTPASARAMAGRVGLNLSEDHWEVIRVLQGCYKDEVAPRIRLLHDALEARFAKKGGMKYLYGILPGGPIAEGCALAGLKPPPGAKDYSYGSVA